MITKFKAFENTNGKPQIGDYVICNENDTICPSEFYVFIENNIGQILN